MENWMTEPEVLAHFAKHYKTGEVIPMEMIKKIDAASKFNQGFGTTEYLAASILDLQWHSLKTAEVQDANEFEKGVLVTTSPSILRMKRVPRVSIGLKYPFHFRPR